jgi:hypothetical protein
MSARRTQLLLGIGAGLLLGALTAGPAGATTTVTIKVTSVTIALHRHDVRPKGASKGDTVVDHDRLLNAVAQFGKKKGAPVGADNTTTTFTGPHSATIKGTVTLPGGTLTLGGELVGLSNGDLAVQVVGGTGKYADARGSLVVGTGRNRVLNTYRLVLPSPFAA